MNAEKYSFGNLDTKNKDEIKEMEKHLLEKYNSIKQNEKEVPQKSKYIPA